MKKNLLSTVLLAAALFLGGHAFALEQNEAGVYQIGTTQDLVDFAALVNDETEGVDNSTACAVLTADIDLTDVTWIPIGSAARRYKGTFDGQFHSIKNMTLRNVKEQGLFGVCDSATVKYVIIDKSCTLRTMEPCTAALIGCCNGKGTLTVLGCVNYADVTGSKENNSAFVGCNFSSGNLKVEIIYCVNFGNISGGWDNGIFSGWFGGGSAGKVYGSVNFGKITEQQDDLTLGRGTTIAKFIHSYDFNAENNANAAFRYPDYTDEIATSGRLCYELNCYEGITGWFQNLGEDALPTLDPTHKQVYAAGENFCDGTPKAPYTYSNDASYSVVTDPHEFENGCCKNCGIPEQDAEGFYLISTAGQLQWFAGLVNDGHTGICAKLQNDIDLKDVNWPSIGTAENYYCGTFDGQYFRIKNLVIDDPENDYRGFFGYISTAVIKHLIIDSSCSFTAKRKAAAFAGTCNGSGTLVFEGCGNEANVFGIQAANGNNAAFIGCNHSSGALFVDMKYCWNTGDISGGNENGVFSGWFANAAKLTGCWNTGFVSESDNTSALARSIPAAGCIRTYDLNSNNVRQDHHLFPNYTPSMLADGTFCFALNGNQEEIGWYQTLGTDPMPTPDPTHKRVYGIGNFYCDGTPKEGVTYSNTEGTAVIDPHNYIHGICDRCGKVDPSVALEQDEEGYYHITSGVGFNIFAALTQTDGTLKCKFDNDIDMEGIEYTPIGNGAILFSGEIDGQQHRIKNLVISNPTENYQGVVGRVKGGFILRNLILDASCSIEGYSYTAGLVGGSNAGGDILIENCGNEAAVTGGGANIASIIGVNMGSSAHFIIKNCYNTGVITGGKEGGAISGWLGDAAELTGVWNSGSVTGIRDGKPLYGFGTAPTCTNCASIEGISQSGFGSFTTEDLEGGGLAWYLNGQVSGGTTWTQTLGEDYWPIPFNTRGIIYTAGTLFCDGTFDPDGGFGFSNEEGAVIIPDHEWENGICVVCGDADPTWKEADEDGWYSIANEHELQWFGGMVKIGNTDIKGRLTDDIDLTGIEWRPIGTEKNPFKGTFDGQCHYIDNMDVSGQNYVGFFGYVTGGADLKNFIVTGTVTGNAFCAGIAGGSTGTGVVKFTNLGNEASVTGAAQNIAGIVGVSMGGGCAFLMNNCYNAGDITGARESAALSGWMGSAASEINNCYNIGTIAGYDEGKPVYRFDGTRIKDLVSTNADSRQGIVLDAASVASGELAFYVNGKQAEGTHFFQTLGEDEYPVPFKEGHETVYAHGTLLCDGTVNLDHLTFANVPGEFEQAEHQFGEDGCCVLCGNAWGISTAQQLLDFSWNVQGRVTDHADAYLLNDIDLKDVDWEPIGYGGTTSTGTDDCIPYAGKFDGQGHRILNMVIDDQSRMFLGFFGCLTGGAEIRNIIIDESCYVRGNAYCAGLAGGSKLSNGAILFENCGNECDVLCDGSNGANAGGLIGCNMNAAATYIIKNCFNTGNIKGVKESGSFCGYIGRYAQVTNCWSSGTIEGIYGDKPFTLFGSATFKNCYDLVNQQADIIRLAPSAAASGELCYCLNEGNTEDPIWRQTIGEDPYPAFNPASGIVYFDDVNYVYTNDLTGVQPIMGDPDATISSVFTLQGVRTHEMQRGINIVRMSNGTVRKVLVK
jgi:hypothetical protein